MSGAAGLTTEIMASNPPAEVAHPHGASLLGLGDGVANKDAAYVKRMSVDVEAVRRSSSAIDREEYPVPTTEELGTLRKVAGTIPTTAWLLCLIEFSERASYYGAKGVFNNFMQFPLPPGGNGAGATAAGSQASAGALGKGTQFASALGMMFSLLAYFVPILGAFIADTKLGRWKTIWIGVILGGVAHIIQIGGAVPSVLQAHHAVAPFVISLVVLAIGAGLFKPNVVPTLIDQYQHQTPYTKVLKSGEKVIVDPETTIARIMLFFYGFVNIGGFYAVATTFSEKYVGFWLAFLTPGIIYFLLPFVLWFLNNRIIKFKPDGSALTKFSKICWAAITTSKFAFWRKDFWERVTPSHSGGSHSWTDQDVKDVRRTVVACAIFLYLPIYNINDNGLGNISTGLPAMMLTNGVPNDVLSNFNSLSIIVAVPILSYIVYPALQRWRIKFGRITRITTGFICAILANAIGAIIQAKVYATNPCGHFASSCIIDGVARVSPISAWTTAPIFILTGLSECFVNVTCYEIAYARSAPGMRSVVMSVFLLMNSIPYIMGEILTPILQDPYFIWVWGAPPIFLAAQTIIFWFRYKHINDEAYIEEANAINAEKIGDEASEDDVPHTIHEKH